MRDGLTEVEGGWPAADMTPRPRRPREASECSSRLATCVRMNCFACIGS
jgi:hypothetical protein